MSPGQMGFVPFDGQTAIDPARLWLGDWWKEIDLPVDWSRLIPGGPLNVEVGFGEGEFLLAMAKLKPDQGFVGLEQYAAGYRKCLKKASSDNLANVLTMLGDAYILLTVAFEDAALESVTVNFPDPWPKKRHARRRLFTEEFFRIAARKLRPGGRLFLATDDSDYAGQAVGALAAVPLLVSEHPATPWLGESPHGIRTRYETKWLAEGRHLHYCFYKKKE